MSLGMLIYRLINFIYFAFIFYSFTFHLRSKNALMIDHWEVDGDSVTLEEELGEGAFGKVYKGVLKESTSPSRRLSIIRPKSPMRRNTLKQTEGLIVAVKMLHGELNLCNVLIRKRLTQMKNITPRWRWSKVKYNYHISLQEWQITINEENFSRRYS